MKRLHVSVLFAVILATLFFCGCPKDDDGPDDGNSLTVQQSVAAGDYHSVALTTSGNVYCWGNDDNGQLGNGMTGIYPQPVSVTSLTDVARIGAGGRHTVAVKKDGTVWTWGSNDYGELGDGTTTRKLVPVAVIGEGGYGTLTGITAVAAGGYFASTGFNNFSHTIALKSDGTVWAWGSNSSGQLGQNSTANSLYPVKVKSIDGSGDLSGVIAIASGAEHCLALLGDGSVVAWGNNAYGQIGNGIAHSLSLSPCHVYDESGITFLGGIVAIGCGNYFSYAVSSDGTIYAWGWSVNYELGNGSNVQSPIPVHVSTDGFNYFTDAAKATGSHGHGVALKSDGSIWCWGSQYLGQLGNGVGGVVSSAYFPVAANVVGSFCSIECGDAHTVAMRNDGSIFCWGSNYRGQLGNLSVSYGSSGDFSVDPVTVTLP
jgi:alpha-tubulin suppressor-like RCC1 family protein